MRFLLLLLVPLLAACASAPWTLVRDEPHPALKDDAKLATFTRGRGAERERKTDVRVGGEDRAVRTVDDVMKYAHPIDSLDAAIAYSALVRELGVEDAGAVGRLVRPDPTLDGPGSGGRYSRADAAIWGIEFLPKARAYAGGFEVTRVVLRPPVAHAVLVNVATAWRLVLIREVVHPDGTIQAIDEKTLSDGQDAVRFAEY